MMCRVVLKVGIHPIANKKASRHDCVLMKPHPKNQSNTHTPSASIDAELGAVSEQNHNGESSAPSADKVAHRAYLHYENNGAAEGNDINDWLRAESELAAEDHLNSAY